jgi:hypothetical protein
MKGQEQLVHPFHPLTNKQDRIWILFLLFHISESYRNALWCGLCDIVRLHPSIQFHGKCILSVKLAGCIEQRWTRVSFLRGQSELREANVVVSRHNFMKGISEFAVWWTALLLCIRNVPGSNTVTDASYQKWYSFVVFSVPPQFSGYSYKPFQVVIQ